MLKKVALILLLLFSKLVFSQDNNSENGWIIKYNPTHSIDFLTFPTITFAIEKRISKNIGINLEIGNQLYSFKNESLDTIYDKPRGFKANVETRWYWKSDDKRNSGFYNGLQLFYRYNQFTRTVSYTHESTSEGFVDTFGVRKMAAGAMLVAGYQYIMPYNFMLEAYFGGGYMYRNIQNNHREFNPDKDEIVEGVDQLINRASVDLSENSGSTVILTIGCRIGYKF